MHNYFQLARALFESQNIQTFIFEPPYTDLERFDAGLRAQFFKSEDYRMIANWILGTQTRTPQCVQENIYLHKVTGKSPSAYRKNAL